jgi:dolichol kinase
VRATGIAGKQRHPLKENVNEMIAVEDLLWLTLAAGLPQMIETSWQSLMLLGISIICLFVDPAQLSTAIPIYMKGRVKSTEIGLQMSNVMLPALLEVMAHHSGRSNSQWTDYSKLATLLVVPESSVSVVLCAIAVFLDPALDTFIACFFMVVWFLLLPMFVSNFTKFFTFGESRVVSLALIVIGAECAKAMYDKKYESDHPKISSLYSLVALSGSISCCGFAYLGNNLRMLSWLPKIGLNVVGPILVVDISLYMTTNFTSSYSFLPLSIQWLSKFLTEKENGFERLWGLFYWVGVLTVGSYPTFVLLSLPSKNKPSVVVTRKWFHLIAVILFGPVTWQFPQLMSLSYAIAFCVLVVLETLRGDTPLLQSFYTAFIDDRKDDGEQIIVSHIFLIIGCAAPLWVSEVLSNRISSPSSSSLLVAEFGVLCIGVGDAMGAVIGKSMGKHKWGKNNRTLEGSLAMWLSMIIVGIFLCSSLRDCLALLVATTFTTILEAFTVQLDNLVLPIAGTSIILLILTSSL